MLKLKTIFAKNSVFDFGVILNTPMKNVQNNLRSNNINNFESASTYKFTQNGTSPWSLSHFFNFTN